MEVNEEEIIEQTSKGLEFKNAVRRMSGQAFDIMSTFRGPEVISNAQNNLKTEDKKEKIDEMNFRIEAMVEDKKKMEKADNMNIPSSLWLWTCQKNLSFFCILMLLCSVTLLLSTLKGHPSKTLQVFRILCLIILFGFNIICICKIYIYTLTIRRSTQKVYIREGFLFQYLIGKSFYMDFNAEEICSINIQQLKGETREEGVIYRNCIQLYGKEKRLYTLSSDQKSNVLNNTGKIYRYLSLLKEEGYLKSHFRTESKNWLKDKVKSILYSRKTHTEKKTSKSYNEGKNKLSEDKIAKAS